MPETDKREWVLHARNIGCVYPDVSDEGKVTSYNGIFVPELYVPRVGVTVIVGSSGSGKSTLLGLLSGLRSNNVREHVKIDQPAILDFQPEGRGARSLLRGQRAPAGEIGFVFQEAQLIKSAFADLNGELGTKIALDGGGTPHVHKLATEFELDGHMDKLSEVLSGGQAQRVAVIRALAVNPSLLVCDEPTSSIDEETGDEIALHIHEWAHREGKAVLWCTHNISQASQVADYVFVVRNGEVLSKKGDRGWPVDLRRQSPESRYEIMRKQTRPREEAAEPVQPPVRLTSARMAKRTVPASAEDGAASPSLLPDLRRLLFRMNPVRMLATILFLVRCGFAEIALPYRRTVQAGKTWWHKAYALVFSPVFRSLTLVVFLGLWVFYGVQTAISVSDRFFDRNLAAPEVSHFIIRSSGGQDTSLDQKNRNRIAKALKEKALLSDNQASQVFGRREQLLTDTWLPASDGCSIASRDAQNPMTLPVRIFEMREPLFGQISALDGQDLAETGTPLSDLPADSVVITRPMLDLLGQHSSGVPDALCVDIYGPALLRVTSVVEKLPGSGGRSFFVGISEQAYRKALRTGRSRTVLTDAQGRFQMPYYTDLALYFDYRKASEIICAFKQLDTCPAGSANVLGGFKLNTEVLEQIDKLVKTASVARIALWVLGATFAIAFGLSTGLAVAAFVRENEKSIAIMRAFGYNFLHVVWMLFAQIAIIALTAIALFLFGLALVEVALVGTISGAFSIDASWITFSVERVGTALGFIGLLVFATTALVLGYWWLRHRYLGQVLQAL